MFQGDFFIWFDYVKQENEKQSYTAFSLNLSFPYHWVFQVFFHSCGCESFIFVEKILFGEIST